MLVGEPLLQGGWQYEKETQKEICSSSTSPILFGKVCFFIWMYFKTSSDLRNLSTDLQHSSCDIYRINSKHKAKHEAMGNTPWCRQAGALYETASSGVSKAHKWLQGSQGTQCVPTQWNNVAKLEALLCLSKISTMKQCWLRNCR